MHAGDQIHLLGVVWEGGVPRVRLRLNGQPSALADLRGMALRFDNDERLSPMCVGHKPFRDATKSWFDCDNAPLPGSRTCDRCTAVDATFASQLHHAHTRGGGEIDPAIRAHLDKPNALYLAAFRDGSIKVGTSNQPRLETRLQEQGAWVARIVATTSNGYAVRVVEDRVTVEIGLPQSVSINRKLAGLTAPQPDEALDRELGRWERTVHALIAELGDDRVVAASTAWTNPAISADGWSRVHAYSQRLDRGRHDVLVDDVCGRAVRLRRPDGSDRFVADIGRLFGLRILLSDSVEADELAVQDSLF